MRQFIISENTMQKTSFRNHQVTRVSSQRSTRRKPENQPTRVILFNKPYDVLPQFTDSKSSSVSKHISVTNFHADIITINQRESQIEIKCFSEKGDQRNVIPAPSRSCRQFVPFSGHSRTRTRRKPENRTLCLCEAALRERQTQKKG